MASGNINIRRDVEDKFYRYKMPRLVAKVEGRGNGIKTVIPNMKDIAKALNRSPNYTTKFFGIELGSLVTCDTAKERYIVNGAHTQERLAQLLDVFIKKFVLCGDCLNPETELVIKPKTDDILMDCKACGAHTRVEATHRLSTYILKNPPAISEYGKKIKKASKGRLDEDGTPTPPSELSGAPGDENDQQGSNAVDDQLTRQINAEAAILEKIKMSADDDDWAEDMSPAAIAARQQALSGGAIKKITAGDDEEEDPLEDFAAFINDNPEASALDLLQEVARLDVREDMAIVVYMQVFFDKTFSSKLISTHADTLKAFMKNEKCQKGLLGGFERLVGEIFPAELMAKVPVLLKAFYDEDIVDEEVILAWGEKPSKKYVEKSVSKEVRAKAKPFLDWLKTADEEESEEDDDE